MVSWNKKHQNLFRKVKSKTNTKLAGQTVIETILCFQVGYNIILQQIQSLAVCAKNIPSLQLLWGKPNKRIIFLVLMVHQFVEIHCVVMQTPLASNAVKAERAAKLPNIADFETFFDTAHAICKRERQISDYPLELKYLTRNSSRKRKHELLQLTVAIVLETLNCQALLFVWSHTQRACGGHHTRQSSGVVQPPLHKKILTRTLVVIKIIIHTSTSLKVLNSWRGEEN